jgi:DMSO/TMAO reductase YedYZ molybdopterin-dependent catalytic subunit
MAVNLWLGLLLTLVAGLLSGNCMLPNSLRYLHRLERVEHITMHHCIQGWAGIAKWSGVPMREVIKLVQPRAAARVIAFVSFGGSLYGGSYYIRSCWKTC